MGQLRATEEGHKFHLPPVMVGPPGQQKLLLLQRWNHLDLLVHQRILIAQSYILVHLTQPYTFSLHNLTPYKTLHDCHCINLAFQKISWHTLSFPVLNTGVFCSEKHSVPDIFIAEEVSGLHLKKGKRGWSGWPGSWQPIGVIGHRGTRRSRGVCYSSSSPTQQCLSGLQQRGTLM